VVVLTLFGQPEEQELVRELQEQTAVAVLVGYAVLTCFVAPIAEEVFFRGFMFQVIARRTGVMWGALVTGVIFGLIHITGSPIESVVVLVAFGVALCFLFVRTGSIVPCIVLHAVNNSISFTVTTELPWWAFFAIVTGSIGSVLLVSRSLIGPGQREGAT
jgi:membrane protease YdiL (CAAX protease family)